MVNNAKNTYITNNKQIYLQKVLLIYNAHKKGVIINMTSIFIFKAYLK